MKGLPVLVLLMLGFAAGPGQAAEPAFQPASHLSWHRRITTDEGETAIAFQEFMKIDWERLARRHFTAYPLAGLSQAEVAELAGKSFYGYTSVDFTAPLPEAYQQARFLFLSADGSRRLEAAALKGTVRYAFDTQGSGIERVAFYGQVIGVPRPADLASGGFVVMLADGQELAGEEVVNDRIPQLDAVNPYGKLKIERQIRYRFAGAEASYLFVQFAADTACDYGCCEFAYMLFREDPASGALAQLRASQYSCDV